MSHEPSDFDQPNLAPRPRIPWFWLLLAAGAGALFLRSLPSTRSLTGEGKKLASLSIEPLTFAGDPLTLDDLKGKVVVLNFWGPWCHACHMELPHVAELAGHYADNDQCRVLAVACGYGDPDPVSSLPKLREEAKAVLSRMELKLAVYADPNARTRSAVDEAAKFEGYPTTLLLDRRGVIRRVWTGYMPGDEQTLAQLVASLLEETGT